MEYCKEDQHVHYGVPEEEEQKWQRLFEEKDKKTKHKFDEIREYKHPRCSVKSKSVEHKGTQIETYLY